jgi:hypothetical protein
MPTTKNTTKSTSTIKVSVRKLPANVIQAFEDINEFEASILESWVVIGTAIVKGATTNADVLHFHPERKSSVSKATKIALAIDLGWEELDEYDSLNTAYESAKAFVSGEDISVDEAKAKSQRKVAGTASAQDYVKANGKKAAMAFALELMAIASK